MYISYWGSAFCNSLCDVVLWNIARTWSARGVVTGRCRLCCLSFGVTSSPGVGVALVGLWWWLWRT